MRMKNRITMTHPTPNRLPNKGFALVATLSLMILLTVIAVGLLGLSAITLRSGSQEQAQMEAHANARLALMIAVGELQKQLGPDQRVSANGAILSQNSVSHPHWTGVWDSWIAGPTSDAPVNPNYPSGESNHETIGSQADAAMRPEYTQKNKHFRAWLLSLDPNEAIKPDAALNLALNGLPMPNKNQDAIRLVGQGSLGEAAPATDFVSARLIGVKPKSSDAEPSGRYAWWVGDESQKARVMHDSYLGETLVSADKIFRSQAPASTGTNTIAGLKDLSDVQQERLEGLPTLPTLDLVPGVQEDGTFRASQKGFHSVTPFSRAVLSDVREGGLKRDLSALLERPIDPTEKSNEFMLYKFDVKDAWANDPAKYPTLPNTPQECVPLQDLAAFYQLYDKSRKAGVQYTSTAIPNSIQVTTPDYGTAADYTTKFQKDYTTLYRNPVPIKVQFLLSLHAELITQADRDLMIGSLKANQWIPATDTHKLRLAVIPAVTMWNPYNVPIVMESSSRAQQIIVKPPPLVLGTRKIRSDGTVYAAPGVMHFDHMISGSWIGRSDIIRLNFARTSPVVFQPGEVRVFSSPANLPFHRYYGGDNSAQTMTSGKNLVDAVSGWDPTAILPLKNSSPRMSNYATTRVPLSADNTNILMENPDRWSITMNANSSDAFEFTFSPETKNGIWLNTWPQSELTSPRGAAFSFYMSQRNFSSEGQVTMANKGYGYLNVRHMSLVSRFGGSRANRSNIPRLFNEQLYNQGATNITLGAPMEPVPASAIAAAAGAGETLPFIQLALMAGCETSEMANGGINGGRKFPSRPFLHSSPIQPTVIDKVDGTAPYNHGWNWWIDEMNSVLESMVQESQSGNGFYGGGYSTESGVTHVVQQEIPVTPPISIAALSHARIGGFTLANEVPIAHGLTGQMMEGINEAELGADNPSSTLGFQRVTATGQGGLFPHVLQAIGNSYANPNLAAGTAFDPAWKRLCDQDDGERDMVFADHSYLANKALWDDYFFSSITPQPSIIEIFGSTSRDAKQVASDFFFNAKPLPNRRIAPYTAGLNPSKLDTLFAAKDTFTNGLADKIASHLMVEGPFNINSTSVDAWKVFFSSLKGKPIAYLDGGKIPKEATTTNTQAPIGMGTLPNGLPADTADTVDARDPEQWKGLRVITEDEIDALAKAMVREVKKRGPFLSLSEFVNRRLDSNNTDGVALKGALQAALDYDGADNAGPEVTINKNFRDKSRTLDSEVGSINFAFKDAAKGPAAYGSSAYVDQADVLRQFAEQLTPRGDTFVIRTYGDSLDAKGNVVARAWCEAVIQRTPDYVDSTDDNQLKTSELQSAANKRFGRSIQIISFRWLNASEV